MTSKRKLVKLTINFTDGAKLVLQEGIDYVNKLSDAMVMDGVLKVLTVDCEDNRCQHNFNLAYVKSWEQDIFYKED